jgi:hypothetical protein
MGRCAAHEQRRHEESHDRATPRVEHARPRARRAHRGRPGGPLRLPALDGGTRRRAAAPAGARRAPRRRHQDRPPLPPADAGAVGGHRRGRDGAQRALRPRLRRRDVHHLRTRRLVLRAGVDGSGLRRPGRDRELPRRSRPDRCAGRRGGQGRPRQTGTDPGGVGHRAPPAVGAPGPVAAQRPDRRRPGRGGRRDRRRARPRGGGCRSVRGRPPGTRRSRAVGLPLRPSGTGRPGPRPGEGGGGDLPAPVRDPGPRVLVADVRDPAHHPGPHRHADRDHQPAHQPGDPRGLRREVGGHGVPRRAAGGRRPGLGAGGAVGRPGAGPALPRPPEGLDVALQAAASSPVPSA